MPGPSLCGSDFSHTHTRVSSSVCVCIQKDKVTFIVVGPLFFFFSSLTRVALNSFSTIYPLYILDPSLRVRRVKKMVSFIFHTVKQTLTHKRDPTQPHTFFNKFIGRKKLYLIVCLGLFSGLKVTMDPGLWD